MTPVVRFLPEPLDDVIESQRWYASRQPGLGHALQKRSRQGLSALQAIQQRFPMGTARCVAWW